MRYAHALIRTHREVASEEELPSARLLAKAGLSRRVASGIYSLGPLATRALRRIEAVIREEMDRIDGQEILLPLVQPAELWLETGRYLTIGSDLARLRDRGDRPMVLAMTHEEAVTDLARAAITSYRQLPMLAYQIQSKFRDEPRPRGGLIRLREFLMKDAYSFHLTQEDLDTTYERVVAAYDAIYRRLRLPVLIVEADTGIMGGKVAHEFMVLADGGEDSLIVCSHCGYAANQEIAVAVKGSRAPTRATPLREVATPGATTIAALCEALGCQAEETLKSVFFKAGESVVMALIRGDLEVNEVKLRNALGQDLSILTDAEAASAGLVRGYAGPVGQTHLRIVGDESVVAGVSWVTGANKAGYHLSGARLGRDFTVELVADIASARAGDACLRCGHTMEARRGIEAGNTFKLGTRYSDMMGLSATDEDGVSRTLIMGCYGLGITRSLACVLEEHHDSQGIIWPVSVAPFAHHLVRMGDDLAVREATEDLYARLGGHTTLYDDREVSAGVKLKDADLLGMPLRLTVSARSLAAGGVELRVRRTGATRIVSLDAAPAACAALLAELDAAEAQQGRREADAPVVA